MAGFFGFFDYSKEGPGVSKDGPKKAPIIVFFEIFGRKFWNLVKINMMFLLFNIPAIIVGLVLALFLLPNIISGEALNTIAEQGDILFTMLIPLIAPFIALPVITTGPAYAGITYILRNYSREEHAFIGSDFKEHALKNFRQSSIVSIVNTLLFVIMLTGIKVYSAMITESFLWTFPMGILFLTLILFIMANMYMYPMMVTVNLTTIQLYKNAFIFALMKFFPNLIILIICIVASLGPFIINPFLGCVMLIFLNFSLVGFITNFYVYPKLKKYIINKVETNKNRKKNEERVFQDRKILKDTKKER